jgi:hypothetical protein
MPARKLFSVLVVACLGGGTGCYKDSVLGSSGSEKPHATEPGTPAAAVPPKVPSVIASKPGESVGLGNPYLGDIDGDGLDDFLLTSVLASGESPGGATLVYLYYGRRDFPAQLSTADADAVFPADGFASGPLGDIDGDGLADFVLSRVGSSEIVFGSRQRLHGEYMPFSVGPIWQPEELPEPFSPRSSNVAMRGIGDVDGDGFDDLILEGAKTVPQEDVGKTDALFGLQVHNYLVMGHAGAWHSENWDMSQAAAEFGYQIIEADPQTNPAQYAQALTPISLGDLDGDGVADIGVHSANGLLVFYGGRKFQGLIRAEDADAHLLMHADLFASIGDADGDGASDLIVSKYEGPMGVLYGRRWSGEQPIEPELTLAMGSPGLYVVTASSGDIDGDAWPEIVIGTEAFGSDSPGTGGPTGAMFVLRGTGSRQTGERRLDERDKLQGGFDAGFPQHFSAEANWSVSMNGDVDGDGGNDILTNTLAMSMGEQAAGAVYLIPSTPKMPD